jgi:hypothetical protein
MPWTPAQHRLFQAAAHDPAIAKKAGIPQAQASKMAAEGVRGKVMAQAIRKNGR